MKKSLLQSLMYGPLNETADGVNYELVQATTASVNGKKLITIVLEEIEEKPAVQQEVKS